MKQNPLETISRRWLLAGISIARVLGAEEEYLSWDSKRAKSN